ncbi:heterokaryon incompatibility [Fusarium albosuccineum]|uniref:Heterokaryon incompatibility n=1 Tax=Fusarium albosuccineum TaxID=1237068 RepID=A0A8H4PMB8_9HYPO|nr:heterokaryon incompatibility [Fusarium albosuccineum]
MQPRLSDQHKSSNKLKLSRIPLEEVTALQSVTQDSRENIRIFDRLGIEGCLLDCEGWKTRGDLVGRQTMTRAQKIQQRHDVRDFDRSSRAKRQTLNSNKGLPNSKFKYKRQSFTLEMLKDSGANGCGCCQFFHDVLQILLPTRGNLNVQGLVFEWTCYSFLLKVWDQGQHFSFQFYAPTGTKPIIQGLKVANISHGDTSSSTSLDLANRWIRNCEATHEHCGSGRDVPLPKRCLDLEPGSIGIDPAIRLVETNGATGTYACLSHCWGKDPIPIKTTSKTIAKHLHSISLAAFPKTFLDAVVLTRKLGLRYLWIDSLCIIQDSDLDWQIESIKMADIYRNSFVTITAISSPDFRGGCFSPERLSDICLRIESDDFETLIAARYCYGEGEVTDIATFREAFPALTKAWIYPERMLSRRILYCTYTELQFECRQNQSCECGNRFMPPHPDPRTAASQAIMQGKDQYTQLMRNYDTDGISSLERLARHWQQTVSQYTKLRLTQSSDKLPALSGCAKDIVRLTGDKYLAGLWRRTFAEGLLWTVRPPVDQPRPYDSRAPSWSWASVDTTQGIHYFHPAASRNIQSFRDRIERIEITPVGIDETGAVKSGRVWIRTSICVAYLRQMCISCHRMTKRTLHIIENDQWVMKRSDGVTATCPVTPNNGIRGLSFHNATPKLYPDYRYTTRVDFQFYARNDGFACRHARVFLLYLYENRSHGPKAAITEFFLVLRRPVQSDNGFPFERIALFSLGFENGEARDAWFRDEYDLAVEQETVIEIK